MNSINLIIIKLFENIEGRSEAFYLAQAEFINIKKICNF